MRANCSVQCPNLGPGRNRALTCFGVGVDGVYRHAGRHGSGGSCRLDQMFALLDPFVENFHV